MVPFRWEYTHQQAFEDIKHLMLACWDHHWKPLKYGPDVLPVNVVTDGCGTGIVGVMSQGKDWHTTDVVAFFLAKLNPAQQNYPIYEIEMLAGVETMLRYQDILQGVKFKWYTDHKGLIHLLQQKNLSGWQAQWMEKITKFNFEVMYIPSTENILSDALSCLYAHNELGTVHAQSEYTYHNIIDNDSLGTPLISMPLLVGAEGISMGMPVELSSSSVEAGPSQSSPSALSTTPHTVLAHLLLTPHLPMEPGLSCLMVSLEGMLDSVDGEISTSGVLDSLSAVSGKVHCGHARKAVPPTETGRPEMAAEFAAHATCSFMLRGPGQYEEGKNGMSQPKEWLTIKLPAQKKPSDSETPPVNQSNLSDQQLPDLEGIHERKFSEHSQALNQFVEPLSPILLDELLSGGREPIDLLDSIRHKYYSDLVFSKILENPQAFKNFDVSQDGLIHRPVAPI